MSSSRARAPRPAAAEGRLTPRRAALVAAGVAAALYARAVTFELSYVDDDVLIGGDQAFLSRPSAVVRAFARPYFAGGERDHAYYRPLVSASFALDTQVGGGAPWAYHATSVALHAL